jgi:hypothetical protein
VELPKIEARCCTKINIAFEICFKWQSLVGLCSSSVVVQRVTYENVEICISKNCRKWKMTPNSKMPKVDYDLKQKCRKFKFMGHFRFSSI